MRRFIVALALAVSVLIPAPAVAAEVAWCEQNPADPRCWAEAERTVPGSSTGSGGGGGGSQRPVPCVEMNAEIAHGGVDCDGCIWYDHAVASRGPARGPIERTPPYVLPPTQVWRFVVCYPSGAGAWVAVPVGSPQPPVSALALAMRARDSFRLPRPVPGTSPAGATLVNLPTYLFVDKRQWLPSTATAAVPGTVVSVTATPTFVTWNLGDGGSITCRGPGSPLVPAAPRPECGYRYHRSSASLTVTATVAYEIAWTCTGTCDRPGGTLDPLLAAGSTQLVVLQARAQLVRG
jgi:hypothetical protein